MTELPKKPKLTALPDDRPIMMPSSDTPFDDPEIAQLAKTVLYEVPDAIIYADRDGIIKFWNRGATRLFGFSAAEAVGKSLDIIIPQRLRQRHWDGYSHMTKTGRSRHAPDQLLSTPAQTKSGGAISIQFTVAPVRHGDGSLSGVVALLRDVTETFQELKRLRAQA